jgi:hypothetical protein
VREVEEVDEPVALLQQPHASSNKRSRRTRRRRGRRRRTNG